MPALGMSGCRDVMSMRLVLLPGMRVLPSASMQNPANLQVRSEALTLAVQTYRLTASFPRHERYGLSSQMTRAAVSVGSNISEGCGRQGDRAMIAFLHQAMGSLNELEFQLEVAKRLAYFTESDAAAVLTTLRGTRRMLARLLVALRKRLAQSVDRP